MGAPHSLCGYGVWYPVGSQAVEKGRLSGESRGTGDLAADFEV